MDPSLIYVNASRSIISNVGRDQHIHLNQGGSSSKETTLLKLQPAAMDAYDRTGCLQGTRVAVIKLITEWALDPTAAQKVLLLHGVAGAGKSTLSTTMANCFREMGCLGAFVFFDRDVAERSNPATVIRTLAYQVGSFRHDSGVAIAEVVDKSPSVCSSPLAIQFQTLLVEPLSTEQVTDANTPIVLVLDALDECGSPKKREMLLEILVDHTIKLPSTVRILITSRSEHDISSAFKSRQHILTQELETQSSHNTHDISSYIQHRMMRVKKKTLLLSDAAWPSDHDIQTLAERASGLFVWASTACEFIDGYDPMKRMDIVLSGGAGSGAGNALDSLYQTALDAAGNWDDEDFVADFTAVIGIVLVARYPLSSTTIDRLLSSQERRPCMYTISHLGCVLQHDPTVRLLHPSFADFLETPSRCSRDIWIFDRIHHNFNLSLHCLSHLDRVLRRNMCDMTLCTELENKSLAEDVAYACRSWIDHICAVTANIPSIMHHLSTFLKRHLLHWFEAMSILGRSRDTTSLLYNLSAWISTNSPDETSLVELVHDAYRFSETFEISIAEHPLLVYFTASLFAPGAGCETSGVWRANSGVEVVSTQRGHKGAVYSIAFSPDETQVVSGANDGTIRVWDINSGVEVVPPLQGHENPVRSVGFSANGAWIVCNSWDKTIRVWDATTGATVLPPPGKQRDSVHAVAFSQDGTRIVSGSHDHSVRVWDAKTGAEILPALQGHEHWVQSVAFSPDGTRIVSGSYDHTVRVWDANTGDEVLPALRGHEGWVQSVVFSSDGAHIVSYDGTIRVWDASSGLLISESAESPGYTHNTFDNLAARPTSVTRDTWLVGLSRGRIISKLPELLCSAASARSLAIGTRSGQLIVMRFRLVSP